MTTTTRTRGRQLFEVALRPVIGSRFQPTGFPDVGPGQFARPVRNGQELEWVDALLVESAQSMANHLEAAGWSRATQAPDPVLDGLPYVRVLAADDRRYLTSSRTEAHRLAAAFVKDAFLDGQPMRDVIRDRLGLRDDTPLAYRDIAASVFSMDPMCLIHGVFFAETAKVWPGQPKIPRALTAFVEATGVRPAVSGGVKKDDVRHAHAESGGSKEGYGTIPFHRMEWTADDITAYFSLDLGQLAAYGLPEPGAELLAAIARWEVRSLLERGFRPRTACDLEPVSEDIRDREGVSLPDLDSLESEIRRLIAECREHLGDGQPIDVMWDAKKARAK